MLRKIKLYSNKLLHRRRLRTRFYLKRNNSNLFPRLSVYKSCGHIYAQVIDDVKGITLASSSTLCKSIKDILKKKKCNMEVAKLIGEDIAKKSLDCGVKQVIFDRGGYTYHGKIKALADAAREKGLRF